MSEKIIAKYRVIKEKDKDEIKKNIAENAKRCGVPFGKFLDQIIRGMIGDAMNSQEKILKEQQRIPKIKKAVDAMVSILNDGEKNSASLATKQFYDDLFTSRIDSVLAKLKK